ncbi:MAG TPA: oxygenase MpaB family protein [Jiangellaceae bacterium]|nr:oxygenase MpaB family protein [Jiangellaceae bacterium]
MAESGRLDAVLQTMVSDQVGAMFRRIVSGDPTGRPPWIQAIEDGDDAGLFGPGSAPWVVHGHLATLAGGVRALLLQASHPGALVGVREHSRFRDDALGRLAGTTRWLVTLTFGSTALAERESARVRRMHQRVRGSYEPPGEPGVRRRYSAADQDLLRWVHVTFTDSFLTAHEAWGGQIPGGPDAYVAAWGRAAQLLGLVDPPRSRAELDEQMLAFEPVLDGGPAVREMARFVLAPPLPVVARPAYAVLGAGAVATLPRVHRERLGLPWVPGRTARLATRGLLAALRLALGDTSPSEQAARARLARLNAGSATAAS